MQGRALNSEAVRRWRLHESLLVRRRRKRRRLERWARRERSCIFENICAVVGARGAGRRRFTVRRGHAVRTDSRRVCTEVKGRSVEGRLVNPAFCTAAMGRRGLVEKLKETQFWSSFADERTPRVHSRLLQQRGIVSIFLYGGEREQAVLVAARAARPTGRRCRGSALLRRPGGGGG